MEQGGWGYEAFWRDAAPAPNGIELSRLASPDPVSRQILDQGWPGRLQRVVRQRQGD